MDADTSVVNTSFIPMVRAWARMEAAKEVSDSELYLPVTYSFEMAIKWLVLELLAGLLMDKENHRSAVEYRLVRASAIGEWCDAASQLVVGTANQHLLFESRESQRSLMQKVPADADVWQSRAFSHLRLAFGELQAFGIQMDPGPTKVSLLDWMGRYAHLRNKTKGHGSVPSVVLGRVACHLERSLREVVENAPAFSRSWAYLHRNQNGKYRVSSIGGPREPFQYLAGEPEHRLDGDGIYVFLDRPRLVTLAYSDPDLADFFHPNGNYTNDEFELLSHLSGVSRRLHSSQWAVEPSWRPVSETSSQPEMGLVGDTFTNVPPAIEDYVPRPGLEAELLSVIADDRNPVLSLHGRGGIGKTSLALTVLEQVAQSGAFFAISWLSARDIDLRVDGAKLVRPDVYTLKDIAADFTRVMSSNLSEREAMEYLGSCLAGRTADGPFLFVIDNFETVADQADVYNYFNTSVRLPNKVLITTRVRDFKADYPIEVPGMSWDEFAQLVSEHSLRLGMAPLAGSLLKDLYSESDGHPYIAKLLLGELSMSRNARPSLRRVNARDHGVLTALFERSFGALSTQAQRVFLLLSSWRSMVPVLGLMAVVSRPGQERFDVDSVVSELTRFSLVETREVDGVAFFKVPLAAQLFGASKRAVSALDPLVVADLEVLRALGVITPDSKRGLSANMESLAREATALSRAGGDPEQVLSVLEYMGSEVASALLVRARVLRDIGDLPAASQALGAYLQRAPGDLDAWRDWIGILESLNRPVEEVHAWLQLAKTPGSEARELGQAARRLTHYIANGELQDVVVREAMVSGLRLVMEARAAELDAASHSRLAWLCVNAGDRQAGVRWAEAGLLLDSNDDHCRRFLEKFRDQ